MKELAAVGDVLAGKYRVDKILGIGGMGMVVAATHLELEQRVALKFMLPSSQESAESSARFLREARAAGRLNSEHVCRVMDVGRFDSGAPYIVMEYLQGENLAAVLRRRGPLRVSEAVDYILQAVEGLAEAHAHGIIHRDLKPDNLFLAKRNDGGAVVKVLDFGISKVGIGVSTRTGDIMGSPAYMAPEQMESSRNVDQRADVWSLGVVLYQLVVGRPPFRGDTLPLLCMHVVNDQPPPMSAVRGDLPDGFEAVVMRCLEKEPTDRYTDVGELATALAPFGPKNASTSASRIQIVLRRARDSSVVIANEVPIAAPVAAKRRPTTRPPVRPPTPSPVAARPEPGSTTESTSGQTISTMRTTRSSWGTTAAVLVALGVAAMVVVALWRGGEADLAGGGSVVTPGSAATGSQEPATHGPIVEPIEVAPTPPPPPTAAVAVDPKLAPGVDPKVDPKAPAVPVAPSGPEPVPVAPGPVAGNAPPHVGSAGKLVEPAPGARVDRRPEVRDGRDGRPDPRRPRRPGGRRGGPGSGSPAAPHPDPEPGAGSAPPGPGSGSAGDPDDDDKWTHMTHDTRDDKKP